MSYVPEFYSVNEYKKPKDEQVHHNNGKCGAAILYLYVSNLAVQVAIDSVKTALN